MRPRARTPDELDALLEDAFVLRDRRAVAALFESDALLVDAAAGQARGAGGIASWATQTWKRGLTYAAAEPRVLQAGDTALVLTPDGIAVARRHDHRAWRYAIALLSVEHTTAEEEQ
jgi:ketosteroid isomerase-like protein